MTFSFHFVEEAEYLSSGNHGDSSLSEQELDYLQQNAAICLNANPKNIVYSKSNIQIPLGKIHYAKGLKKAIMQMPVLDQGGTNTCATFSSTAGIDILAGGNKDSFDIYSDLCMGDYLSHQPANSLNSIIQNEVKLFGWSFPDPWNGTFIDYALAQDLAYGMIQGPTPDGQDNNFGKNTDNSLELNPADAQLIHPSFSFTPLWFQDPTNPKNGFVNSQTLNRGYKTKSDVIIKALKEGKLVVIMLGLDASTYPNGMLAAIYPDASNPNCYDIGSASSSKAPDAWIYNDKIAQDILNHISGTDAHAILVTGYIPTSDNGGFFILRNSWGANGGSNGNIFASYDYVNNLSTEAAVISAA